MIVKAKRAIDSNSLGRIIKPGEFADLPIDENDILIQKGFVEIATQEEIDAYLGEGDDGTEPAFRLNPTPDGGEPLLTDHDAEEVP